MTKIYLTYFFSIFCLTVFAQQEGDFSFAELNISHLKETSYLQDTTADAYVIKEFGSAYISEVEGRGLVFHYHVKIKILTNKGLDQANISIPLRKGENTFESIRSIEAVTINLDDGMPVITNLDPKKVYTEKVSDYYERRKFTFPNAKVGSIIEYKFAIESPFIFNFRNWEFQSEIPKLESEYWAKIPANYNYNIALIGFKKLDKNDPELIKDCFRIGSGVADCSLLKFGMKNIPAFMEEDYMTAPANFIAAIKFELMEIKYFTGTVQKFTKTWADVYKELKSDTDFGLQIKRNSELFKNEILALRATNSNQTDLAKRVYEVVKNRYSWDEYYGKYAKNGLKKAYELKSGNVGDINLALIGALQHAGFNTDPVLISTRENGFPTKLFPVMSEFNYVIAKVNIGDESYLLDATDKDLPFGMLPFRCLNKEGRAIGKDSCYWVNLTPKEKYKQIDYLDLKLDSLGNFVGKINIKSIGYQALYKRKKIKTFASTDEYIENLDEKLPNLKVKNYKISYLDSLALPLIEEYEVIIKGFDSMDTKTLAINPFIFNRTTENPFKLNERVYPIDFGAQKEFSTIFRLVIPENYEIKLMPTSVALKLPENGGRYVFSTVSYNPTEVTGSETFSINSAEIPGEQYPYLKEIYNKIVQSNKSNIMISKK